MCAGCPHRGLFYSPVKKLKLTVLGDIGCYTLGAAAPLNAHGDDALHGRVHQHGIHGFNKAVGPEKSERKTVAVIGDSTFMHSGMTGLANIAYNQSNSTVIILDNSITGMTGHQQNPTTGLTTCKGAVRRGKIRFGAAVPGHGHLHASAWWTPMTWPACRPGGDARSWPRPGAVGHHHAAGPALLLKYVKRQAAAGGGSRQVRGLQELHEASAARR